MSDHPRQSLADVGLTPAGQTDQGVPDAERDHEAPVAQATEAPRAAPVGRTTGAAPRAEPAPVHDAKASSSDTPVVAIIAIVAGVIGLFVVGIVFGIIAIAAGAWARRAAVKRPDGRGKTLSLVGVGLGALDIVLAIIVLAT